MLEISGLTKSFGRLPVLRGVDLTVGRGRVTAVLGPNGAGKSTLIKAVLGLTRPDAGTIRLGGVPIAGPGAAGHAHRARIGYMPQLAAFPAHLTGAELIAMLRDLRGAPAAGDDPLVEALALAPHLGKPLGTLSGGTRQKVNAVLALLFRPDLLILDEPTAGLDPVSSGVLKDRVLAERAAGCTVVVTSHVLSEVEELADDVAFLVDGRVRYAGPVEALLRETRQTRLERAVAQLMRGAPAPAAEAAA
ncbi:ABC transporter ATP-binding protein [Roseisolibacter sp. H3M3-2]|uniref:ABC transporter ATP-binding protein n=1 Tax=Roseisolibacter sp. H3M3-2 TaxID=3031323 RepID=UPI0023DBBD28|nr:ABC transporter ATP-binding protein [Roseisolibacter sp. H3M3-2]MDF1504647.1 ABC transporter ATP-binding protein [Roseisolibacter sp. H3M3-2]